MRSLALLLTVGFALPASAKATAEVGLSLAQVYSSALRFVRVDRGCTIGDKDADAAYVMFECALDNGKKSRGALELVPSEKDKTVRIQVALPDEPKYVELRFIELFERKLRDDFGTTATGPKKPDKAPPPTEKPAEKPEKKEPPKPGDFVEPQ